MSVLQEILQGLYDNRGVSYLGPGVLGDARSKLTGERRQPDPGHERRQADGAQLMYEFPRAAMNLELKKGRGFATQFLTKTYRDTHWTRAALHDWLASFKPAYVVDINRDTP